MSWDSFLMKKLLKSEVCRTRELCMGVLFIIEKSKHVARRKKKRKEMQTWIRNRYSVLPIWIFIIWMCVYIYLCIYIHLKINKLVYYISYNNDGNNAVGLVNSECWKVKTCCWEKKKRERNANLDPNGYSVLPIWIFIIWMCVYIYLCIYTPKN